MRTLTKFFFASFLITCLACAHSLIIPLEANQINKGIRAGASALPYFVYSGISLPVLNEKFKNSNASITIEDIYDAAYQCSFNDMPEDGNTDQAFTNMEAASQYLQDILKLKKADHSENYFLTAIGTTNEDGYILLAVIYRPETTINVFNKFDFLFRQTLTPEDIDFYRAYRTNTSGKPQDIVYDWAALPNPCVSQQAYQAILLTLIANKILDQKPDNTYWREERQWIAGNHLSVLVKQDMQVSQMLGFEKGFTQHQKIGYK